MEAILQGWLTKSPPEKKQFKLFGSKWRKRYFVLYAPPTVDGIPDARTAILEYYSSKKLHNKCGTINLSDCEEVLSSLDSDIFEHVFGLRTMHKSHLRTYYLAAATEVEMNKWVNRLCQVLGLTENDDGLSPPLHLPSRPGLHLKPLHMTQPMGIPGSTRQTTFQSRPLTHQPHPNFGPLSSTSSSSGLLSPAPPPLRPVPSTPAADPFSRLNISEPNLLDAAKGYAQNRRDVMDDGQRITSPPFSSRLTSPPAAPSSSSALKSAGSFPELDRFSPTTRKPGHLLAGEGREFMELPPIPPEKTGSKVCVVVEPMRDAAYDLPKQKYYERSDGEEKETRRMNRTTNDDDWYNSPPSRYNNNINNGQPLDNSFYNSPPSRYNSAQPPKSDCCNVLPPDRYRSMGGGSGLGGVSQEGIRVDGHEWYNTPQKNSSSSEMAFHASSVKTEEMKMGDATDVAPPPLKPKRFTQDNDDCYNVPRPSANGGGANWNDEEAGGGGWWDVAQNVRQHDSEDCYNVPKSQQDKRKHVSQREELYNIAKSQSGVSSSSSNLPRQKSDRRSYGGRGCVAAVDGYDRNSRYRSSYGPSEDDYDMPKQRGIATRRPESGHGDLGLYNIPGLSMPVSNATDDDDDDFYSRPKTGRETTTMEERQRPSFNGDRPSEKVVVVLPPKTAHRLNEDGPRQPVANWLDGVDYGNDDPYNLIPPFVSSNQPTFPASSSSHPSADLRRQQQTNNVNVDVKLELPSSNFSPSDSKLLSVTGDKLQAQETRVEVDGGENAKSTELKKTPSGAYKQNKAAVQSSTSLHKKQAVQAAAAGGLPLHDSIRFTQRTKSFKRSIPSQDRSTLPLPVKRIVERSESSSSSSSDDGSDQNNSTHSAKQR